MRKKKLTSLIVLVFVLLCNCDYFKSLCEPENDPKKQPTTLQNIVNNATDGEIINLEEWENVTDYTATIDKKLTIKSGNLNGASLTVKAENVKLEKMQNLSVETSSRLTIKDSKLNNLLLGGNAQSRSNTTAEINVILENCEIAEKIKINSQAKLNITGKKTKIAKIVVAVVETLCKIFCADELDTTEIKDIIVDEDNKKLENVKVSKAYKIIYHSNCDEQEDIEDFFSPDDGTISLPTDIFKRNGYIFAGWYKDEACKQIFDNFDVSDKTADIHVYAEWESKFYSYELEIKNLVFEWGGGFSVLLLTDEQLKVCKDAKDFKQATAEKPEYQIAAFGDMIVDTTKEGNFAVYGRDNKSQPYDGVAVTIENNTFTLFIDMTKLTKTQLKALYKDTGNGDEAFMTEDDTVNLTDYKPYIIALGTKGSLFTSLTWDADLMAMTGNATFPTNLQQSAPTTGNTNEVKELTATADDVGTVIAGLSAGTYTLKVSGTITNTTITEIANAMNSNTEAKINLDLSDTDGLTEIPKKSFQFCNNLISINIPKSVTIINSQSFEDSGLTNVMLPNNLQNIGKYAFFKCSNLASIEIPDSVTTIGDQAFHSCSSLTSVTFNNTSGWYYTNNSDFTGGEEIVVTDPAQNAENLKDTYSGYYWYRPTELTATADTVAATIRNLSAGTYMLKVSGEITSATIRAIATAMNSNTEAKINLDLSGANGVTTIDNYAFSDCSSLTSVKIGNGVTSIGVSAFSYCLSLTSVKIPDNVIEIKENAFNHCTALNSVTIGNGVTSIGDYAFSDCSGLTSIEIPNSVTTIGSSAFNSCSSLKSITIPDSVESIGSFSFVGCNNLTTFEVDTNNSNFSSSNDKLILFNKNKTELIAYPSAKDDVTTILDSDSVTTIKSGAFSYCSSLTSVTIPNSVTSIDSDAFYRCSGLTSIEIPNSVTSIGARAFSYCSGLTSITIGNKVTSIGDYAFSDCSSLTSIEIPNRVTTIGSNAFYYCENLTSVTFADTTSTWYYTESSDYTGGTVIDDVTDTAQNATKLKENDKYWYKESSTGGTAE